MVTANRSVPTATTVSGCTVASPSRRLAMTRASEKITKGVTRKPFFNVRIAKRKS